MKDVSPAPSVEPQRAGPTRRQFLVAGPAAGAALVIPGLPAVAQTSPSGRWCATWGTAPAGPPPSASTQSFTNQTLRLIAHASIGGSRVRVRISNEMGSTPLRIGRASIALRTGGASIATPRALSFGGTASVVVPPGAPILSDPVDLTVAAQADIAVSLYLPGTVQATTIHDAAFQTNYISTAGDYTSTIALPVSRSISSWPFLTEIDIAAPVPAIVAIGDSITDGARSTTNANRRWPDYLARRLQASLGSAGRMGVVNRGISANLLLTDYPNALLAGRDTLERFDRDVLATAGVRYLISLIGINDICYSPGSNPIPVGDLIAGWRQMIMRAHARDITIIGATLPPFEGFVYYTAARESVRRAANNWIRASGEFDALFDVDAVLRDPANPARILPAYDSGDRLHPNDAGYQAMANAVPLAPFVSGSTVSELA